MIEIKRRSPANLGASPMETELRDNWTVVMKYGNEGDGNGPWLADLAHKTRWDLQDAKTGEIAPCDILVPEKPGDCVLKNDILINRMNKTQASVWHLGASKPELPDHPGYTDVGEATVFLALFGSNVYGIAEKLCALDFMDPSKEPPFLLQGPLCRVPCQTVALERNDDGYGVLLLTCSRGYGQSMVDAILTSGEEFGLRPAGETRFAQHVRALQEK